MPLYVDRAATVIDFFVDHCQLAERVLARDLRPDERPVHALVHGHPDAVPVRHGRGRAAALRRPADRRRADAGRPRAARGRGQLPAHDVRVGLPAAAGLRARPAPATRTGWRPAERFGGSCWHPGRGRLLVPRLRRARDGPHLARRRGSAPPTPSSRAGPSSRSRCSPCCTGSPARSATSTAAAPGGRLHHRHLRRAGRVPAD